VDLRRETEIDQLRRASLAQRVQIDQLLRVISAQAPERGASRGK
jgi:hypothetical protein